MLKTDKAMAEEEVEIIPLKREPCLEGHNPLQNIGKA
jgi:hypothetical protein